MHGRLTGLALGRHGGAQRAEVPFPEVTGGVALLLKHASEGEFLGGEVTAVGVVNAHAIVVTAGEHGGPGGGTDGVAGIKVGEGDSAGGEGVEIGSLDDLIAVEAGIAVAEVIRHDEDDVGGGSRDRTKEEPAAESEGGEDSFHLNWSYSGFT